jgi:hypothetical protein
MLRKSVAIPPRPLYAFKAYKEPTLPGCDNAQFGIHWKLLHSLHGGSGNEPLLPEDDVRRFLLNTYTHHNAHVTSSFRT